MENCGLVKTTFTSLSLSMRVALSTNSPRRHNIPYSSRMDRYVRMIYSPLVHSSKLRHSHTNARARCIITELCVFFFIRLPIVSEHVRLNYSLWTLRSRFTMYLYVHENSRIKFYATRAFSFHRETNLSFAPDFSVKHLLLTRPNQGFGTVEGREKSSKRWIFLLNNPQPGKIKIKW